MGHAGAALTKDDAPGREFAVEGKTAADVFSEPGLASLARAACQGEISVVDRAVKAGANPNGVGLEGTTPLFWALRCENLAGVEALLRLGANPNQKFPGEAGFSPVFAAAGMKDGAFLKLMLAHGGDPNASIDDGGDWTALKAALFRGMDENGWDNFEALLDGGADINRPQGGVTIAELAANLRLFDVVADLLRRGYRHDLPRIAFTANAAFLPSMSENQKKWRLVVLRMLEERGVKPVRD